ncbi:VOC family protein [Amycolatopsis alba]|uniref:Lyase n=1 Tax=Amycolatopsis alba DSM 44262 TaxID=1125972 RepID=A0A229R8G3_AMYAL|nr:lyase [Amycolatopsis alba DSM 44262]
MELTLTCCALVVHDLDEAIGFYRDVLGFEVRDDGRLVSVGPPSQPDLRIVLTPSDVEHVPLGGLGFVTDNCDATFEHIEASGAEVMQEPIDRPDGVRDCAFFDPSGNVLRFSQKRVADVLPDAEFGAGDVRVQDYGRPFPESVSPSREPRRCPGSCSAAGRTRGGTRG